MSEPNLSPEAAPALRRCPSLRLVLAILYAHGPATPDEVHSLLPEGQEMEHETVAYRLRRLVRLGLATRRNRGHQREYAAQLAPTPGGAGGAGDE